MKLTFQPPQKAKHKNKMLYTRKGDDGTSSLYKSKDRITKNHPVFEALGGLDELNSLLGVCFAKYQCEKPVLFNVCKIIRTIQHNLFIIQAGLAGAEKSIPKSRIEEMEYIIGEIESYIEKPNSFVIAGATELSALFDYARALSRRTERSVISANLRLDKQLSPETLSYLNRLSSLLYALARYEAFLSHKKEEVPVY